MNEVLSFLTSWLVDLVVLGSALLTVTYLASLFLRHPTARMALARGTFLGLAILCVLTALPFWPRQSLVEALSREAVDQDVAEPVPLLPHTSAVYPSPLVIEAPV